MRRRSIVPLLAGALAMLTVVGGVGGVALAVDHLSVEPGSNGNLLILVFENTDPQMFLQSAVVPASLPDYVEFIHPEKAMMYPATPPGGFGLVQFVFDVAGSAAPGRIDLAEFTVLHGGSVGGGDSTSVSVTLEVEPPVPLARDVTVVFRADMTTADPLPGGGDLVTAVVDDTLPIGLADDGVPPDVAAGDGVWSGAHTFLGGEPRQHRYLLAINGVPECDFAEFQDERIFTIFDSVFDAGIAQELPEAQWELCTIVSAPVASTLSLAPNAPNPFQALTTFGWSQPRAGPITLSIYDVRGRLVAQPVAGREYPAGRHRVDWVAEGAMGGDLASGVYYMRLELDGKAGPTRRMLLIR